MTLKNKTNSVKSDFIAITEIVIVGLLTLILAPSSWAISKLPLAIPIKISNEKIVFSFKELLDDANDGEIREIAVCRRFGSLCIKKVADVQFPHDFREQEMTMFQIYPQAVQLQQDSPALHAGGSYTLFVYFRERGRKQTVSNTIAFFAWYKQEQDLRSKPLANALRAESGKIRTAEHHPPPGTTLPFTNHPSAISRKLVER